MKKEYRLDKYLADMGIGTRSEVKEYIKKRMVRVNNVIIRASDTKINIETDKVEYKNQIVEYVTYEYFMLNKPQGFVSATQDKANETVVDIIKDRKRKDIFPVGRLDKDTEGLLILTNDGELAHELLSPKKHVDKVYYAKLDAEVTIEQVELFKLGVVIEGGYKTLPATLDLLGKEKNSEIKITIHEGKFHQVKKMFEAVGREVIYLKRLSMGQIVLDDKLTLGEYRALNDEELKYLRSMKG